MSYSGGSRYRSPSASPYRRGRSLSRYSSRSRSHSRDSSVENPGNNLYVTGLSSRIRKDELEKHFATEGKVTDVHLVVDPWTRESRGFGFVTMATLEDANRCIKYLDGSVLEGRVITVEKARRRRGRTPTPGRYLGARVASARHRSRSYSSGRDGSCSPYYRSHRSRSRSSYYRRHRSRSYSLYYRRHRSRSYSPYYRRRHRSRSYSPYYRRRYWSPSRSMSPYDRYSRSPIRMRHQSRSYSLYYSRRHRSPSRSMSPHDRYNWSPIRRRHRSYSRSPISRRYRSYSRDSSSYSPARSISPYHRGALRRSYPLSVSPRPRRSRSYSCSVSPEARRSYSRSASPLSWVSSPSPSLLKRRHSRESYSHSRSRGSRSVSSSPVRSG